VESPFAPQVYAQTRTRGHGHTVNTEGTAVTIINISRLRTWVKAREAMYRYRELRRIRVTSLRIRNASRDKS
jgi:hypothetical protein